jgi:hypothetical protein
MGDCDVRSTRPEGKVSAGVAAISDDDLLELYREHRSANVIARLTGYHGRHVRHRLQKLRDRGMLTEQTVRDPDDVSDEELWSEYVLKPNPRHIAQKLRIPFDHVCRRLVELRQTRAPLTSESPGAAGAVEQMLYSFPDEDPKTGAKLKRISVSLHEGFLKDEFTQEPVKVSMDGGRATYEVGKPALVVEPFKSPIKAYNPVGISDVQTERIFVVGDQQMGFWAVLDPNDPKKFTFVPFHDLRAQDIQMQALALYQPDRVVIVGDYFDFPQLSRFQQEPAWAQTMQATIQDGYEYLCKIRATVGTKCKIDFIPGNHETRMQRAICNNNPALYNLRRPGEAWSIYSVPSLMKFNELGIECAAEYPSGEVWIAQRQGRIPGFVITHADPAKKDLRADSMHGHLVLPSWEVRQVFYEDGPVTYRRWCVSGAANYSNSADKTRLTQTTTPSGKTRMAAIPAFATIDIDKKTGLRHVHVWDYDSADGVRFIGKILTSAISTKAT